MRARPLHREIAYSAKQERPFSTAAMEVLVVAAHDTALLDDLRGVLHRALEAPAMDMDILMTVSDSPETPLESNQLLLWQGNRPITSLVSMIHTQVQPESIPFVTAANNASAEAEAQMARRIHKRDRKIKSLVAEVDSLKVQLDAALARIKFVESEQEQFFEDVQHMKNAFDNLHSSHQKLLWEYLPSRHPDMKAIPRVTSSVTESESAIGPYPFSDVLGYGQYATVFASHLPDAPHEALAVKAIDKGKLVDLVTLHRVNSEIASLRDPAIHHPGILGLRDVIHTNRHIYLVTERGGKDLFDFFGPHDEGVPEDTMQTIMLRVALAVQTLHRNNYCHRDLKPENILYDPIHPSTTSTVKIVDFGLCTKASTSEDAMLHDFGGSPGFFAPELLLQDRYDGRQADLWSIGCILLELTLGNEKFATMWMRMYELEMLRDRDKFAALVEQTVEAMREYCCSPKWQYSAPLRQLLVALLCVDPKQRLSIHDMLAHSWFDDVLRRSTSGSPRLKTRSPTRSKLPLATSSSFTEGTHSPANSTRDHESDRRPHSAEDEPLYGSPHVSALACAVNSTTPRMESTGLTAPAPPHKTPSAKVCLPSISPEKPVGARSLDKSFAKRSPSAVLQMPSASGGHEHSHHSSSSSSSSSRGIGSGHQDESHPH